MKIDVFSHFLPKMYFEGLGRKVVAGIDLSKLSPWILGDNAALTDIDVRVRFMDRYPDVRQVLSLPLPALEDALVTRSDAVALARTANDALAEIVAKYPDRFIGAVACLPLSDPDAAMEEADRAITQLGLRRVQIFTSIDGEPLDVLKFKPLYERMARYDLPIWIHPADPPIWRRLLGDQLIALKLGWPVETSIAMVRLARAGVFEEHPDIKFITHHCGAMIPYFERRIGIEQLRKFYNDTAVDGNTAALMCAYAYCGADNLLFATDMPFAGAEGSYGVTSETIRSIEQMDVPAIDKDKIFEGNARRLLNLTA
ncbi:MAG: amidohydrolase family protein [Dehalococcoidia bacterium]|nr:amidohydrolase family protein [Dehalococcoidia bacterium]